MFIPKNSYKLYAMSNILQKCTFRYELDITNILKDNLFIIESTQLLKII